MTDAAADITASTYGTRTDWMTPDKRTSALPKALLYACLTTILCSIVSWVYAWTNARQGRPVPYSWPYYYVPPGPGLPHGDRFGDLTFFAARFKFFHSPTFFKDGLGPPFPYPAPVSLAYRFFMPTFHRPEVAFLLVMVCFLVIAATIFIRRLVANGLSAKTAIAFTLITALFSEVFVFEAHQANAELYIFILLSSALFLYVERLYNWAAVLLGIAIAMKLYPFILLGLFVPLKRYKGIGISIVTAAVCSVLSLWAESSNLVLSLHATAAGLSWFTHTFALHVDQAIGWDHSIFGFIKLVPHSDSGIRKLSRIYMPVAAITCLIAYAVRIRHLPLFNQIACLTIISILIPPVSFEYTLLHLYSIFALFACMLLRQRSGFASGRVAKCVGMCFGFLFSVQGLFIVHGRTSEGQVKCLVLSVLLLLVLLVPMPDEELDSALA